MSESLLDAIRVVLYEPQNPINIAATIRAMKNMGVRNIALVRSVPFDPYRLEGIAHDTGDIIERIQTYQEYEDAVADCVHVMAFTARRRAAKMRIITAKEAAGVAIDVAATGPVALVFGREDNGLPNEIVDRANSVVTIPTTDHASINLAQAALIALYELHLAAGDATRVLPPARKETEPPTQRELERFYEDAHASLAAIDFFKTRNAEHIMRSLHAVISRAAPDSRELMLLRAMHIEVVRYLERTGRHP